MKRAEAGIASTSRRMGRRHDATHRPVRNSHRLTRHRRCRIECDGVSGHDRATERLAARGDRHRTGRHVLRRLARQRRRLRRQLAYRRGGHSRAWVAGRVAVGVDYDRGRLFVAGGGTGDGFVYDAETGATIATYDFAVRGAGHVRQRRHRHAYGRLVHGVEKRGPLQGSARAERRTGPRLRNRAAHLTRLRDPPANSNGIDATPNGKTLDHRPEQSRHAVHSRPADRVRRPDRADRGDALNGDGILLDGRMLYVVKNFQNRIAVDRARARPRLRHGLDTHHEARDSTSRRPIDEFGSGCTP